MLLWCVASLVALTAADTSCHPEETSATGSALLQYELKDSLVSKAMSEGDELMPLTFEYKVKEGKVKGKGKGKGNLVSKAYSGGDELMRLTFDGSKCAGKPKTKWGDLGRRIKRKECMQKCLKKPDCKYVVHKGRQERNRGKCTQFSECSEFQSKRKRYWVVWKRVEEGEAAAAPPPTPAPAPPPSVLYGSVTTDKTHYARNSIMNVTWHLRGIKKWRRYQDKVVFVAAHEATPEFINNLNWNGFGHLMRYSARMWLNTCGTCGCRETGITDGSLLFGPGGAGEGKPHGMSSVLAEGCYRVIIIASAPGDAIPWCGNRCRQIVAVSEQISIGGDEMTLCKPPSWHPAPEGTDVKVSNLGRGEGFSVTAHRFPVAGRPFQPLGGMKIHPNEGKLRLGRWFFGPGTSYGGYGQPKRLFAAVRSDGRDGVVWHPGGNTIQATWVSDGIATSQTIYSGGGGLASVAFSNETDELIMLLIYGLDKGRFVKVNYATNETVKETEKFPLARLGIGAYGYLSSMSAMVWNTEQGRVGLVISGTMAWGHQGACRSIIDANTLERIQGPSQTSSHSNTISLALTSGGNFLDAELGDNFPRGLNLVDFNKGRSSSFLAYTYKAGSTNDNNVYTELAQPGVVEVKDGYLVFFSSERPPLDKSLLAGGLNVARNTGFVKINRDLAKKEVLSEGPTEIGNFTNFQKAFIVQKNKGVVWLTNFSSKSTSVSRLKTARLQDGNIMLYWEVWTWLTYQYSQMMLIDDDGAPQAGPWTINSTMALPFSDDMTVNGGRAVAYTGSCDTTCEGGGGACWVTGKDNAKGCYLIRYELCAAADC